MLKHLGEISCPARIHSNIICSDSVCKHQGRTFKWKTLPALSDESLTNKSQMNEQAFCLFGSRSGLMKFTSPLFRIPLGSSCVLHGSSFNILIVFMKVFVVATTTVLRYWHYPILKPIYLQIWVHKHHDFHIAQETTVYTVVLVGKSVITLQHCFVNLMYRMQDEIHWLSM